MRIGDVCAVCGRVLEANVSAYLLVAKPATERIAILRWNSAVAAHDYVRGACSPEHSLEMVAHWMVSGGLELTFTKSRGESNETSQPPQTQATVPTGLPRPIGELVIDRESVRKLVADDPEALASVLDSLLEILLHDRNAPPRKRPVASPVRRQRVNVA